MTKKIKKNSPEKINAVEVWIAINGLNKEVKFTNENIKLINEKINVLTINISTLEQKI